MRKTRMAAVAAALVLGAVGAQAAPANFELSFDELLTYSVVDLTPDDGQAAGVTFYGGPLPTGSTFPTDYDIHKGWLYGFADEYFTRFTLAPHTQLNFDGFIDASVSVPPQKGGAKYGAAINASTWVIWNADHAWRSAGVLPIAGAFYSKSLSDHEYSAIHFVLTNDTDLTDYGQLGVHFADSFWATSDAPEAPPAAMLGLGLLGLAAIKRRWANS